MNSIIGIGTILFLIILVIVVLILISCVKIVHQAQAVVVERLGAYLTTQACILSFLLLTVWQDASTLKNRLWTSRPSP